MTAVRPRTRGTHIWALTSLTIALALVTCSIQPTALIRVRSSGELRVATTNASTTCYDGRDGPTGYECDLLTALADDMGAKLKLVMVKNGAAAIDAVLDGRADMAAAGLAITADRREEVRFSSPIQQVRLQVVYRADHRRPGDPGELSGRLLVPAQSPMSAVLESLRGRYPKLRWQETQQEGPEDLINSVLTGAIDYTIANSDLVAIDQRYAQRLRIAFDLTGDQEIAWALPRGQDESLYNAVQDFLQRLGPQGLARERDRWFGHVDEDDYSGVVQFISDVQTRLPRYRVAFENAADRYHLDWRLLAAIGYQESHWDPKAVSPTGVRGLMMLTFDTATRVEVAHRENPIESINGGARYFSETRDALPDSILEPDRTWMALAAYNQGLGHLLDARLLAVKLARNPDRWLDVSDMLPLLSREQWYQQTRHGYARGNEAVNYVANVRSYFDLLVWMSNGSNTIPKPPGRPERPVAKSAAGLPAARLANVRE